MPLLRTASVAGVAARAATATTSQCSRGRHTDECCQNNDQKKLLPICAAIGAGMLDGLRGAGLKVTLTFGCATLLYLVTEELLIEAHEFPGHLFRPQCFSPTFFRS
jgi:hypothetical protein